MTYAQMEARLFARARAGMKLGLDRMQRALSELGNPHLCAPVIHVAGTNGKGSTCAFLEAGLRAAGLRTGLYTSPHLERFTERFQVHATPAANGEILSIYEHLEASLPWAFEGPDALTFFELVTLIAFVHFARARVDVLVVEVGMGGRHDATNVVRPVASCITPIGFDHMEFLGPTLSAIAGEKAGIIKPGVPCISAAQHPEAAEVIAREAARAGAPLLLEGTDFAWTESIGGGRWAGRAWRIDGLRPGLRGPHQRSNAAVALAALEASCALLPVQPDHARHGIARARWPGRLETVVESPEVVLDGAHNPHGAAALAQALPLVFPGRRVHLVLGMLADKEASPVVGALVPIAATLTVTTPRSPRALPAADLAALCEAACGASARVVPDPVEAVRAAMAHAAADDLVLVCGSLYLVGEVRAGLRGERSGGPAELLRAPEGA